MNFVNEIFPETILNPPVLCRQYAFSNHINYAYNYQNHVINEEVNINEEDIFRSIPTNIIADDVPMHRRSYSETNSKLKELNLKRINTY
jgi:hypothetical protein